MTQGSGDLAKRGLPLADCSVLVTRPSQDARALADAVQAWGGRPIIAPLIEVAYPGGAPSFAPVLESTRRFDVVAVTSANGVLGWFQCDQTHALHDLVSDAQWYVVGARTHQTLEGYGIQGRIPQGCQTGSDLANHLALQRCGPPVDGNRLLYLRGALASANFRRVLVEAGWEVTECVCYHVQPAPWPGEAWQAFVDSPPPRVVLLFSPSAVQNLVNHTMNHEQLPPSWLSGTVIACVGKTTAKACEDAGLPVHAVASRPDREDLLAAAAAALQTPRDNSRIVAEDDTEGDLS